VCENDNICHTILYTHIVRTHLYITYSVYYYFYYYIITIIVFYCVCVCVCVCVHYACVAGVPIRLDRLPGGELIKRSLVLIPTYLIYTPHNANRGSIVPQAQAYYYITGYSIGIYSYAHTHIHTNRHFTSTRR